MPARKEPFALELIRRAAEDLVAASSLRVAAQEIGMSTSGLWSFLQGGEPQHGTSRKLQRWFVGKGQHRVAEGPDAELARAALNLLLQEWPLLARDEASRRIAVLLETLAAERGLAVPRWLTEEEPAPKKKPGI